MAPRRILFLHPQGPGQFRALAARLAERPGVRVLLLHRGEAAPAPVPGVRTLGYRPARHAGPPAHPWAAWSDAALRAGQGALRACLGLKARGFVPDLVVAHPGWGDALFLRDAFPAAKLLLYCEYFWHGSGTDVGFADEAGTDLESQCRIRLRNAPLLASLAAADGFLAPTRWQRDLHPAWLRPAIAVIHDGIDTARIRPDAAARFALPDGRVLTQGDEVLTYVARGLEPQRGFPQFMRALPELLAARPGLRVVVCGSDTVSYSHRPPGHATWRAAMQAELGPMPERVHFVGTLDYERYLGLLKISALHLYPSVPFVLSWSLTEAMAAGCLVLASDTAPVREFVTEGETGFLVEMRDPPAMARRAAELLAARDRLGAVRAAARRTIEERCALPACLAAQEALIEGMFAAPAATEARQSGLAMP